MPYDIRFIHGRDFVHLDAEGHFDWPATRQFFSDAIWACVRSNVGRVLVDVRDAKAVLTAIQLCALADVCKDVSPPTDEHKIAILNCAGEQFDRASFLAGLAQDQGWNIAAFQEFESAFQWLSS